MLIDIKNSPLVEVLDILLKDRTTGKTIIWATDAYESYGDGFRDFDHLVARDFIGARSLIIRPRIEKSLDEQKERTRKKAEVFTPAWLCNQMNNFCDEEWFGKAGVFNTENSDNTWKVNEDKIIFPEGKTWKDYVLSTRLEITCGEAPYLVSRYDTATGILIEPPKARIGLLDRKLRVINENVALEDKNMWLNWCRKAYQSSYGYEFQGDSLLIARSNLFLTFYDYYQERFGEDPSLKDAREIAKVISWNLWQMDGLTDTVPLGKPYVKNEVLSGDDILFGDSSLDDLGVGSDAEPVLCTIKNWKNKKTITFRSCKEK